MAECLEQAMKSVGLNMVVVSYDDFYLTRSEQEKLGDENFFLSGRGVAGTHDLKLGQDVINDLTTCKGPTRVPVYDKSAFSGKGDRSETWREVQGPFDLVLVEGWMLGYKPVDEILEKKMEEAYPGMAKVN